SAADRVRNSPASFSSRATKSWTALRSRSKSASVSFSPRWLLTVFLNFGQNFVQFFEHGDGFVHIGEEFSHVALLEFPAFGVIPVIPGLVPPGGKSLRD